MEYLTHSVECFISTLKRIKSFVRSSQEENMGQFVTGESNGRGIRMLKFANRYRLIVANTPFPHKLSRTTTWHAPND